VRRDLGIETIEADLIPTHIVRQDKDDVGATALDFGIGERICGSERKGGCSEQKA